MDKKKSRIIILIAFVFISAPLYSQTDVEQATRETDILRQKEKIEEELKKIPEKPEEVIPKKIPPKKEEEKFFIKKINLVGCESFPPQEFSSIITKYENKELTFLELETLTKEIEREYLRRGIIAAVFVPEQEIKEQTLTIQVVEARMGDLEIPDQKYFRKKRLSYYWKIPKGEILNYGKIAKGVQLMNKNPDREVRAALHAGKKPGTTDVALTAKTYFPMHLVSSYDREGVPSTGKSRIGIGIRHNNFLGFDDMLLTGYTFGDNFNGKYVYHSLPISPNGTTLLYGYSRSKSIPKKEYAAYGLRANAQNTSISIHQDIYGKQGYVGEVFLGFDANDKAIREDVDVINRDRLRVFSLGSSFVKRDFQSSTYINPEFSQGVDAFGASKKRNPLASRGAKSTFSKFNLGLQHKRLLPLNLQANLKIQTQVASTKLTPQEEFSLGGIDSVRGYPAGDYLADNAALSSVELLIPAFFIPGRWRLPYSADTLKDQTTTLAFLDYGWGDRRGALPTEKKSVEFLGVGAGLRFRLFNQVVLRLEWGFPVGNKSITESGNSRFHFSIDFQEKLPQEIERIKKMREEKT
jgi:hemolysin activation/secretion protein